MFKRCLPLNMAANEETTPFHKPGWISVPEHCPKPWRYQTAHRLHTTSFQGQTYSYGGGGYVADLGYSFTSAKEVVDNLEQTVWIDDKTAGVFVEFALFEPSSSLVSSVRYLYERLATGQTHTETKIHTLTLYSPAEPGFHKVYEICQLLFICVICLVLFGEMVKLGRTGTAYFKHFWNWLELIEIISAAFSVIMLVEKEKYTSYFVENVRANPFETSSVDYLVLWSDLEVTLLAFVIFIVTIKLLRIIRYNRHVCQMMATLKRSCSALVSFSAVFITALLGFSHLGYLLFGHNLEAYSTFGDTLRSMLVMTLGGRLYYNEVFSISAVIGPTFLFVYLLLVGCILVNIFVTILMETYGRVREDDADFSDADLCDFMADYIWEAIKSLRIKLSSPEQLAFPWTPRRRESSGAGLVRLKNVRNKKVSSTSEINDLNISPTEMDPHVQKTGIKGVEISAKETDISNSLHSLVLYSSLSPLRKMLLLCVDEEINEDLILSVIIQGWK